MEKFRLKLAEEKTRVIQFGRFAIESKAEYGEKTETFDFLGFKTHMWCREEWRIHADKKAYS